MCADTRLELPAEITPEMIEAGVSVLRSYVHERAHEDLAEAVESVFRAMQGSSAETCRSQKTIATSRRSVR